MWRSVLACLLALVMLGVSIPTRPAYAAPPPNDNFAAAAVAALSSSATAVTTEATTEAGEPMPTTDTCITQPTPLGKTVWYTFLAPTTTTQLRVSTAASPHPDYDTFIAIYTGTALNGLTFLTCNDNADGSVQSRVSFTAQAGTTYRIQVGAVGNTAFFGGNLTVAFSEDVPPNDASNQGIDIGATLPVTKTMATNFATTDLVESLPNNTNCPPMSGVPGKTVWYTFTRSETAPVLITTTASYDPVVSVFQMVGGALSRLACNNDASGTSTQARLVFAPQVGTPYFVQVAGRGSSGPAGGNLSITFDFAPPTNDKYTQAFAITPDFPTLVLSDTRGATTDTAEPIPTAASCDSEMGSKVFGKSAWYTLTVSETTAMSLSTSGATFDTVLAVYTNPVTVITGLQPVLCNYAAGNQSGRLFTAEVGRVYYIQVGGAGSAGPVGGAFSLNLAVGPPVNDHFGQAITIPSSLPQSVLLDTRNATTEPTEPIPTSANCDPEMASQTFGKSAWYTFTSPTTRRVSLSTSGAGFNTVLGIYTGSALNGLTRILCNFAAGDQFGRQFTAQAGTVYHIQLGGAGGGVTGGPVTMALALVPADVSLSMLATPNSVAVGETAFFTIQGTNAGPNDVSGLKITIPVPPGSTLTGYSASFGQINQVGGAVTVTTASMSSGTSFHIQLDVAPAAPGTITATATATTDTFDPNTANNVASASTVVTGPCSPRPKVGIQAAPDGAGHLRVVVTAGRGNLTNIQFGTAARPLANAQVSVQNGPATITNGQVVTPVAGTAQVVFFVTRTTAGQPSTVPLVVTDECGAWLSFVGRGPTAF